jgi:hypothetical protein
MASVAALVAAASAVGVYSVRRLVPSAEIRDFTEPPQTNWESVLRIHEVVRVSWQEALSKLGIWRPDHILAGGVAEGNASSVERAYAARCACRADARTDVRDSARGGRVTPHRRLSCPRVWCFVHSNCIQLLALTVVLGDPSVGLFGT